MGLLGFVARSDWRYLPSHARVGDDSVRELSRTTGDGEPAGREAPDAGNYYMRGSERGEPAGVWFGPGVRTLGFEPGEAVTPEAMELVCGRLVHPATGEALGSRPRSYASHEERVERLLAAEPEASPERRAEITFAARSRQREACHYYDLTYSPEKSWSVLYAGLRQAGLDAEAEVLWSCLLEAYRAGLEHAMDQACYARVGRHSGRVAERTSGRWEKASEWTSTLWRHHTSRDGDPQLHIHGAVLNRVRLADGRWMALDGTAVKNVRRGAASVMSRTSEALASERLGIRFVTRQDGLGREIAGVDADLIAQFSSRRRAIEGRTEEIAAAFTDLYGRAPSRYELRLFAEQATLQTRRPDEHRELAAASDGDLFNRLQTWRRREAAAPPNVDEQLATTNRQHVAADREARLLQAEIDTDREAGQDVDRKLSQHEAFAAAATRHRAEADTLEDAATRRSTWYEDTAPDRRAADLAYRELTRRLDHLPSEADRGESPVARNEQPGRAPARERGSREERSTEQGARRTETLQRIHEARREQDRDRADDDRSPGDRDLQRDEPGDTEREV